MLVQSVVWGCTGAFTTVEKAGAHLKGGVKRVITFPPSADAPMFVMGMNHEKYDNPFKTISNASYTGPLAKVIHFNFVIVKRFMTSPCHRCHQKTVDGPSGRLVHVICGAAQNIIPASTGLAKAVGKLTGMSFHVPNHKVPVVDLTCHIDKAAKYDITTVVKQASESPLRGILGCTEDQVAACSFDSDSHSPGFDAEAVIVRASSLKLVPWCDSSRVVGLMAFEGL